MILSRHSTGNPAPLNTRSACAHLQASVNAFPLGYPPSNAFPSAMVVLFLSCDGLSTYLCPPLDHDLPGRETRAYLYPPAWDRGGTPNNVS